MRNRKDLSPVFKKILASRYDNYKVYFQPPAGQKMEYPCITYALTDIPEEYADNKSFIRHKHYIVTLIGFDADNDDIIEQLLDLQYCSYDRRFISDNLYHDVFDLYY